jgi:hypothetical protein
MAHAKSISKVLWGKLREPIKRTNSVKLKPGDTVRVVGSRDATMASAALTLMAGICLVIPALTGLSAGEPRPLSPMPMLVVIPTFVLHVGAMFIPVAFFFAWNPNLFRGEATVPKRTYWLLGITILLNVAWFVSGWKWGVQFEGMRYVRIVGITNAAWAALLVALFAVFRKRESFKKNLFLHWMLFAWLSWYAFPYLGELP